MRQKLSKGAKDREPHGKKRLEEYGAKASLAKAWDPLRSGTWIEKAGRDAKGRNRDEGLGGWKQRWEWADAWLAVTSSRAPRQPSSLGTLSPHSTRVT